MPDPVSETIPQVRLRQLNAHPVDASQSYVVYWVTTARRRYYNFALQFAVERAATLRMPLVIFDALTLNDPSANDRHHAFAMQAMADFADLTRDSGVMHLPYVERAEHDCARVVEELMSHAAEVITDDVLPQTRTEIAFEYAQRSAVRVVAVDGHGLLPLRAADRAFPTAQEFRRFLQQELPSHLVHAPVHDPLADYTCIPETEPRLSTSSWPLADIAWLRKFPVHTLPIPHHVEIADDIGGYTEARSALDSFLRGRLGDYIENRHHPDESAASHLSPWIAGGHIGVHEIFHELMTNAGWSLADVANSVPTGKRTGWWNVDANTEGFLEQLITSRELAFNGAAHLPDYASFESLPDWTRRTLSVHQYDPRPTTYAFGELVEAQTTDRVWNAAQNELRRTGRLQSYLRMVWGKKILEWTASPTHAAELMIELNNTYALDGRDPAAYAGIYWVLGRYDRASGPERQVFGTVRYMSSTSAMRKLRMEEYLERFAP